MACAEWTHILRASKAKVLFAYKNSIVKTILNIDGLVCYTDLWITSISYGHSVCQIDFFAVRCFVTIILWSMTFETLDVVKNLWFFDVFEYFGQL